MELDLPLLVFNLALSIPLLCDLVCMYVLHMHGRCMLLHGGQPVYCSSGSTHRLCFEAGSTADQGELTD